MLAFDATHDKEFAQYLVNESCIFMNYSRVTNSSKFNTVRATAIQAAVS